MILTAVQMETRAVRRALAGLPVDVITIGIRGCRVPVDVGQPAPAETVVILAGLGGSLDPSLKVGDVVVDDPAGLLSGSVEGLRRGSIYGSDQIVATPIEKAELFKRTGAVAVDMESGVVRALNVRMINIRAISDGADEVLDPRVIGLVDDVGRARPMKIGAALVKSPGLAPYLNRLGKNSKIACQALGVAVRRVVEALQG
jgi:adenosylhomocysteine nucleosidase